MNGLLWNINSCEFFPILFIGILDDSMFTYQEIKLRVRQKF